MQIRPSPCASCPYRRDVPPGIWDAAEYDLLPRYDRDMALQPSGVFRCHSSPHLVCAGWAGHRDPLDLLGVRLGIITGRLDPAAASYTTPVPLFSSGAEAAAHGLSALDDPPPSARRAQDKFLAARSRRRRGIDR